MHISISTAVALVVAACSSGADNSQSSTTSADTEAAPSTPPASASPPPAPAPRAAAEREAAPDAEVRRLLTQIVPEIARGDVQVRAIARDPGRRTKVALSATDPDIDAIQAAVGNEHGDRAQRLVEALNGEPVDYVPWFDEPSRLVANAVAPIAVQLIVEDEESGAFAIVVADHDVDPLAEIHLSLAARLAARELAAMPESHYSETRGLDDWSGLPTAHPNR
jgi:transcription antitermination factor NusA-like protein